MVDPTLVRQSRNAVRSLIGNRLAADWQQTWKQLVGQGTYRPDAAGSGRRALRNLALEYWMQSGDPAAHQAAQAQLAQADNMTERQAALQVLVNSPPRLASRRSRTSQPNSPTNRW